MSAENLKLVTTLQEDICTNEQISLLLQQGTHDNIQIVCASEAAFN